MKDFNKKLQCPWMPPAITRLYIERAAYERLVREGHPQRAVTVLDIEAEMAEVVRRRGGSR